MYLIVKMCPVSVIVFMVIIFDNVSGLYSLKTGSNDESIINKIESDDIILINNEDCITLDRASELVKVIHIH